MGVGRYVSSSIYGGDAYTVIQNAAADTGSNVQDGNMIMQNRSEYIFILAGLGSPVEGITPLISKVEEE